MTIPPPPQFGLPEKPKPTKGFKKPAHLPPAVYPDGTPVKGNPNHKNPSRTLTTPPEEQPDTIINTHNLKTDGLDKCPSCGSTEITYNITTHSLTCNHCRHTWNEANAETTYGFDTHITSLQGTTLGSGAGNITEDTTTITIKCQGCGAEIVLKADKELQTRCHWCRQKLSLNTQIPNGAIPDAVLPFKITHAEAVEEITQFVNKRKLFAWKKFKKEFTPENIVGVYLPYMVIDANLSAHLKGIAEKQTRRYTIQTGVGDNKRTETRYDADVYHIERNFNYTVDDLITESSHERANQDVSENTNNVINAILPYDIKNAVTYNSNYLGNFTSEKRTLNIKQMDEYVKHQFLSIARSKATQSAALYDRGIRWEEEGLDVHGTRWVAVYVPVWLYSYYVPTSPTTGFTHHIAVNGRNKKTMGSIPVSHIKLTLASLTIFATLFTPATIYALTNGIT